MTTHPRRRFAAFSHIHRRCRGRGLALADFVSIAPDFADLFADVATAFAFQPS
ncbi:MAG: hypothetical protein ACYDEP_10560 [Acidimicrobiales bacterium]